MTEKIIDEVMGLVEIYRQEVIKVMEGDGSIIDTHISEESIRAKLREVLERKPLTDEQILELQESHVGGVCPQYPLDNADWINFARAIELANGIGS